MSRRYSIKFDREDVALTPGKVYDVRLDNDGEENLATLRFIRPRTIDYVDAVADLNKKSWVDKTWIFEMLSGNAYLKFSNGSMIDDNGGEAVMIDVRVFMVVAVGDVNAVEAALRVQEMMQMMTAPVQFQKIEMPKHEVADRPRNRNWHITSRNKRKK